MSDDTHTQPKIVGDGVAGEAAGSGVTDGDRSDAVPHDDYFQRALDSGDPPLHALARARADSSPFLNEDDEQRRQTGAYYFPKLLAAFIGRHTDGYVTAFDRVQLAMALKSDGELVVSVGGSSIRFDWSQCQATILTLERLAADIRTWIREPAFVGASDQAGSENDVASQSHVPTSERKRLSASVFGLATLVGGAMNVENLRHPRLVDKAPEAATPEHEQTFVQLGPEIEDVKRRFRESAERQALSDYARGMLFGIFGSAIVSGILFGALALAGAPAFYGVAVPAGALGAAVSVLQRMTKGKMRVEYQTRRHLLIVYGALRPVVGAIFGELVFGLFVAGLVPAVAVPTNHGTLIAWYAVFAFIGGFSERFAQDMLEGVTKVLPDPGLSAD